MNRLKLKKTVDGGTVIVNIEAQIKKTQEQVRVDYSSLLRNLDVLVKQCEQDDRPGMAQKYANDREAIRKIYVTHF